VDELVAIQHAVTKAADDAGIQDGSAIRQHLVHDSEMTFAGEIVTPDPDGRSVTLAERLEQMRSETKWRADFPQKPAAGAGKPARPVAIPGAVLSPDLAAFDQIVKGTAKVTG